MSDDIEVAKELLKVRRQIKKVEAVLVELRKKESLIIFDYINPKEA